MAQGNITPVQQNGALHVQNGQVVNKNNLPPQLQGISFSWSIWRGQKYYNPAVVDWLCSDFNTSIIRLAMAVQPEGGYLEQPELQQKLINTTLKRAIKDGIYVLIDWHDHNSSQHLQQSKQFFEKMAKRYHGVPNVIYEIWNEPERVSWDTVKNYAVQVIATIREHDRDNLIIVGSPHWDQDVDVLAQSPITGFNNIAYSFHFYASDPNHQAGLRAKAEKAMKAGIPLFVTEWGVGEANGNGKFDMDENKTWLNWLQKNKLSWANWNLTDKEETTAILKPGAPETGGWTADELTPAGTYIRDVLREGIR